MRLENSIDEADNMVSEKLKEEGYDKEAEFFHKQEKEMLKKLKEKKEKEAKEKAEKKS